MHVVVAAQHYPPRYIGGVEIYSSWIARALAESGCIVTVIAIEGVSCPPAPPVVFSSTDEDGVHVIRLRLREDRFWTFEYSYRNDDLGTWFRHALGELRPDVVHIQGGYRLSGAVTEASLEHRAAKTVVTLHDYWHLCPSVNLLKPKGSICDGRVEPGDCVACCRSLHAAGEQVVEDWMDGAEPSYLQKMSYRSHYLRSLLEAADLVISPSQAVAQTHRLANIRFRDLRVVRLGLPASGVRRPVAARGPTTSGVLRVSFIGTLLHHKGAHVLTQAVMHAHAEGARVHCSIYGPQTSQPEYVHGLVRQHGHGSYIEFKGAYELSDLSRILDEQSDVVVVPSLWPENSPLVVLLALANATPVIASDVGGIGEFVRHGENGFLFPPGDVFALASVLRTLSATPEALAALRAHAKYDRSSEAEAAELLELYSHCGVG